MALPHVTPRVPTRGVTGLVVKACLLGLAVGVAVFALPGLIDRRSWIGVAIIAVTTALLLWVYLSRRRVAAKYLVPGTIVLVAFQLYPVLYTVSTAFTNYGDGHRVSQAQAIQQIIADSVQEVPGSSQYQLSLATKGDPATAPFVFFLTAPGGTVYQGDTHGLTRVPASEVTKAQDTEQVIKASGWTILNALQVNARSAQLASFAVPVPGGFIKSVGISQAFVGHETIRYDPRTDTMTDTRTHLVYYARDGAFVAADGKQLETGWQTGVGFANFRSVFTDPQLRGPFLGILAWTIIFAVLSVALTFGLGLGLALVLNHPRLRGRRLYRSLLLLPYALPAFISLLVWQSMYNQDFGLINNLLHLHVDWLGNPWTARAAVLLTNTWLGFPYMFLVCTGMLQSIPGELQDAAKVDGAGSFTAFRSVVLPLLMIGTMPLLISSFAFNFNNYNAIRLLTNGGPFPPSNSTAGSTDILISYTFRIAFGGQGAQYGVAATISVFIFLIIAGISAAGFRRTRALEEVNR